MKTTSTKWISTIFFVILFMTNVLAQRAPQENWVEEPGMVFNTEGISFSRGIACGEGKLFVTDAEGGKDISVYDAEDGSLLTSFGQSDLILPKTLAYQAGKLFIIDTHTIITVLTSDGISVTNWGGSGSADGQFSSARDIAVDANYVYVVDYGLHRVQVFTHNGSFVRKWGSNGGVLGQFINPAGIAIDHHYVYVTDNNQNPDYTAAHRIQVFDLEGNFIRSWIVHTNLEWDGRDHYNLEAVTVDDNNVYVVGTLKATGHSGWNNKLWIYDKLGNELDTYYWYDRPYDNDTTKGVAVANPFVYVTTGNRGLIRTVRRVSRTLGQLPLNRVPLGDVLQVEQRESTFILDIDYYVSDPDNSNLTVYAAAFVTESNAVPSLDNIVPMRSFIEGSVSNIGPSIATGTMHRLSWDMGTDAVESYITDYGNLKVSLLVHDNRDLLDLHLLHLPSVGTNSAIVINRAPIQQEDLLPVWYWWLSAGDTNISLSTGTVYGKSGSYTGQELASGTNTTALGREYLFSQLGYREATPSELQFAREATTPGSITKRSPRRAPPLLDYKVNEFNFVTEPTNGWWVVPLP